MKFATLNEIHNDKQAIAKREEDLIKSLEEPLRELGYRVVRITDGGSTAFRRADDARRLHCPDCPRTFALPLHLGRHRQAMHVATK